MPRERRGFRSGGGGGILAAVGDREGEGSNASDVVGVRAGNGGGKVQDHGTNDEGSEVGQQEGGHHESTPARSA